MAYPSALCLSVSVIIQSRLRGSNPHAGINISFVSFYFGKFACCFSLASYEKHAEHNILLRGCQGKI